MRRFALIWLFALLCGAASAWANPVQITPEAEQINVSAQVTYLRDAGGTLSIHDVQDMTFLDHESTNLSLGFTTDVVWLKFVVGSPQNETRDWVVEIGHPLLDRVELFAPSPDGGWGSTLGGDMVLPSDRDKDLRAIAFDLPLIAGTDQAFFLKVTTKSSMLFPVTLYDADRYQTRTAVVETGFGLFYGSLIVLALYNLSLFLSIRDPSYLLYSLAVISTTLFQTTLSGHAGFYLWHMYPEWNNPVSLFSLVATICFSMWFSIRFLETRTHVPRWHLAFVGIVLCGFLLVPLYWAIGYSASISIGARLSVVAGVLGLLAGIWCLRAGVYSAKFYVLARTGFCIGSILTAGRQLGIMPDSFITEHAMRMGGLAEALLLAFALSDRYNQLRAEKEAAQRQTADELRRLDKLKDEILANTSHELRTPLQGIIGISESMLDGAAGDLNKTARHNLSMLAQSGHRLSRLVDDILDFSRLRTRDLRLKLVPTDLRVAVDLAVALARPLLRDRPVTLENAIDPNTPLVIADETRLQQILSNLIGNAVKFTDTGSITIRAVAEGRSIRIDVEDTGIGIPEDAIKRIFESFEQVDGDATRERGGAGLGLSVTARLAELQGGGVTVTSAVGVGSTFSFTLPVAQADDIAKSGGSPTTQAAPTPAFLPEDHLDADDLPLLHSADDNLIRILVVDDEPVNQQVLANHLRLARYSVTQALNGPDALRLIETEPPFDLVLLDVMMPRMSGFEVCEKLRQTHLATELPVIMVTAKTQSEDMVNGLSAGANDYISKPISKHVLLARIKTHMNLLRINKAYGNFVPQDFLRHLGKESIIDVELGDNVEMDLAILWSDVRNFTSAFEGMTPGESFEFINGYFQRMGPVIRQHGGFVNSFIGDAIMALFVDGAQAAIAAALASSARLEDYNRNRLARGENPIEAGFAVHVGIARLGVVGETRRMQGEVFSDAVNLASRLEDLTKTYGSRIIVSADAKDRLPEGVFSFRKLDRVRVKGRNAFIDIFELLDQLPDQTLREATRSTFESALAARHEHDTNGASKGFQLVLDQNPNDAAARHHLTETLSALVEPGKSTAGRSD
jgi:two-component system sensor histidine kinase ChiS